MSEYFVLIKDWLSDPLLNSVIRVMLLLLIVMPLMYAVARTIGRMAEKRFSQQVGMLVGKGIAYASFVLITVIVLNEFGFQLGALLGAAGIAAIAIGLAAQTSLSNIISGIFLISEKTFKVGDLVRIGDDTGVVLSIDLLSVKIRAMDNRFIRVPNEDLIKTRLINLTHFPIRRIDIEVGVAYKEDPRRVLELLKEIAHAYPLCLDDPEPVVLFKQFGASSLDFMFGVWCVRTDYLEVKNNIMSIVKERFDQEGIEIPFPHLTLYTGAQTAPMPIQMMPADAADHSASAAASVEGEP